MQHVQGLPSFAPACTAFPMVLLWGFVLPHRFWTRPTPMFRISIPPSWDSGPSTRHASTKGESGAGVDGCSA